MPVRWVVVRVEADSVKGVVTAKCIVRHGGTVERLFIAVDGAKRRIDRVPARSRIVVGGHERILSPAAG
jgi:hypothetical protein